MKKALTTLIILSLFSLTGADAFAQGKLYTRKAKLEDFPTRTTKVVTSSTNLLELRLREEISTSWRISPFEFCTAKEFNAQNTDNSLYFLYIGQLQGLSYLVLYKGGKPDETESLLKPFEVVRVPLAATGSPNGRELLFMAGFIDILQAFVEDSMVSDAAAYNGLRWYNERSLEGKKVYLDPDMADDAFYEGEPDALAAISIAPHTPEEGNICFKMLISTDTHELFYFEQCRFRTPADAGFGPKDVRKIMKRNGNIVK